MYIFFELFLPLIASLACANEAIRGRNNSRISGSQQDYLVGKSGSPQIYLVDIWPRFKQNNMTNTKF